jgi:hypothetical protein
VFPCRFSHSSILSPLSHTTSPRLGGGQQCPGYSLSPAWALPGPHAPPDRAYPVRRLVPPTRPKPRKGPGWNCHQRPEFGFTSRAC